MLRKLLGVMTALIIVAGPLLETKPAAAWQTSEDNTGASMAMASMAHSFVPVKAGLLSGLSVGTGGNSFQSTGIGVGTTIYFDVRSDSSVPLDFKGTVSVERLGGLTLLPQVTIYSCSVAWNLLLGTCPGTMSVLSGPYRNATSAEFTWARLNPGASVYLAVTTGVEIGNMRMSASAFSTPTRAAQDRTFG